MFGLIEGLVKLILNIVKSIFLILGGIFSFIYSKVKFIFDILGDDIKTEKKIKAFRRKRIKMFKLNDEV